MAEEKKGGISVYISPEIVEVLKQRHKKNYEAGVAAGIQPSVYHAVFPERGDIQHAKHHAGYPGH